MEELANMGTTEIFGAAGGLSIVLIAVLNALKKAGMPKRFTPLVAVLLGATLGVVASLIGAVPSLEAWQAAIAGIGVGGTSTVLYSVHREIRKSNSPDDTGFRGDAEDTKPDVPDVPKE